MGVRMKFERISVWLSVLANLSVLVGLILLVVEIRHKTSATRAVLHQELMSYVRDHIELLVTDENEKFAMIIYWGESHPDSLSAVMLKKFVFFTAY